MLYKLKGNLKDGVSFSFDKLKHIKFGEIGLVDIYIPGYEVFQTPESLNVKRVSEGHLKGAEKVSERLSPRDAKSEGRLVQGALNSKDASERLSPKDALSSEITFLFVPEELNLEDAPERRLEGYARRILTKYTIAINLGQGLNSAEDIQKNVIYKVKNILETEKKNWAPKYKIDLEVSSISVEFDKNDKLVNKIFDAIESRVLNSENEGLSLIKKEPGKINLGLLIRGVFAIQNLKNLIEEERINLIEEVPLAFDINKFKFEKNNNETRVYSPVKLIITHPGKIFDIPQYVVIESGKETIFKGENQKGVTLSSGQASERHLKDLVQGTLSPKDALDMCVYSNFVEGPIFRFVANKLPAYIKPANVMYFRFGDNIGLFDKLKLTFEGEGLNLTQVKHLKGAEKASERLSPRDAKSEGRLVQGTPLKNVSVMVDLHETE